MSTLSRKKEKSPSSLPITAQEEGPVHSLM